MLLATEVLLSAAAEDALKMDPLEGDLYELRDRLTTELAVGEGTRT
jgi:hypothetical protein